MEEVLTVKDLHVSFSTYGGEVQAVRGVSFQVKQGETLQSWGNQAAEKRDISNHHEAHSQSTGEDTEWIHFV